jgi:hypothetical protein
MIEGIVVFREDGKVEFDTATPIASELFVGHLVNVRPIEGG